MSSFLIPDPNAVFCSPSSISPAIFEAFCLISWSDFFENAMIVVFLQKMTKSRLVLDCIFS